MLFLILAILCSSMISVIMRLSSEKVSAKLSMLAVNYLVCTVCGAAYAGFDFVPEASGISTTVSLGIVSGILYLVSFILLQKNTEKSGIVLSSVFMKLGLLVPIFLSVIFFNEKPSFIQITGFITAIIAIILINIKKDEKTNNFGIGLIMLLLLGGGADAMSKVYEHIGNADLINQFLFYTFLTALILCSCYAIVRKEKPEFKDILFGAVIGIPNFFSSKFLIAALGELPAVVTYPTFSVATILLVTLTGVIVFKEKLSKLQWISLSLIVITLVFLNI